MYQTCSGDFRFKFEHLGTDETGHVACRISVVPSLKQGESEHECESVRRSVDCVRLQSVGHNNWILADSNGSVRSDSFGLSFNVPSRTNTKSLLRLCWEAENLKQAFAIESHCLRLSCGPGDCRSLRYQSRYLGSISTLHISGVSIDFETQSSGRDS